MLWLNVNLSSHKKTAGRKGNQDQEEVCGCVKGDPGSQHAKYKKEDEKE